MSAVEDPLIFMYCCWLKFQIITFKIKIRTNCELSKGKNTTACTQIDFFAFRFFFFFANSKAHFASLKISTMF